MPMIPDPWNPMRWNQHCTQCGTPLVIQIVDNLPTWGVDNSYVCVWCTKAKQVADRLLKGTR